MVSARKEQCSTGPFLSPDIVPRQLGVLARCQKLGPPHEIEAKHGSLDHFTRYAPEHIEYGVNRYVGAKSLGVLRYQRATGIKTRHAVCMESSTAISLAATRNTSLATSVPLRVRNYRPLMPTTRRHVPGSCTRVPRMCRSSRDPARLTKLIRPADICHYGWVASAGWAGVNIDDFPALKAWEERMTARPGVEKGRHVPDPHTIKELLKDKAKMEEHAAKSRAWVQAGMKQDAQKSGGK